MPKDAKKTKEKKPVAKKETEPPKAVKKVEIKPEVAPIVPVPEPKKPKQYFGVHAKLVLKIQDVEIHEKPMKAVYLNDGCMITLSERELETRLTAGENNKPNL